MSSRLANDKPQLEERGNERGAAPTPRSSPKRVLAKAIATFGGTGLFPIASGTVGAAAALAIYAAIVFTGASPGTLSMVWVAGSVVLMFAGVWACSESEEAYGKDGGEMVVDEALGMLVSVAFFEPTILNMVAAFVLFRFFDIVKPWPAGACERLPRGWGVMLDDLVAGLYANVVLRIGLVAWAALRG
jgi:phosphatidylglycerophosphatase A